jgi:hypothetical protein
MLVAGDSHWREQVDGCSAAAAARFPSSSSVGSAEFSSACVLLLHKRAMGMEKDRNTFPVLMIHCCIFRNGEKK